MPMNNTVATITAGVSLAVCALCTGAHGVDMSVVSGAGYRAWVDGRRVEVLEIPAPSMHDHQLPDDAARPYSAAIFDAEGTVTVRVESDADLSNTRILPLSRGIVPQLDGARALTFRAKPPFTLSVEPMSRHEALILSARTCLDTRPTLRSTT